MSGLARTSSAMLSDGVGSVGTIAIAMANAHSEKRRNTKTCLRMATRKQGKAVSAWKRGSEIDCEINTIKWNHEKTEVDRKGLTEE